MNYLPALLLLFLYSANAYNVNIKDLRLYVDCQEYVIKGMCYSPVPQAWSTINPDFTGGGGYCSPKRTAYGEWRSACFDSDFFDGSSDIPDRDPPGPPGGGWFQATWERDFPLLKELGVNTLRLYNMNPTTRKASIEQLGTNGIIEANGKDHIPFMNMAEQYGFKIIFPLVSDQQMLRANTPDYMKQLLKNQIDEVGNHSALLMWNFGNELDYDESVITMMNDYIAFIRNYTWTKYNRFVPITTAVRDTPSLYDWMVRELNVDIFTANAGYRGPSFWDLWTGGGGFSGFKNLSKTYNKPLFIGEFGWHQINNSINKALPDWFNQIYSDLVRNIDNGCVGGAFFEYSDEQEKGDDAERTMGVVHLSVDGPSGNSSMDPNVWKVDTATRKDYIFAAMSSGSLNGTVINYNSDVWQLMGRARTSLGPQECVPPPVPSTTGTPTSGTTPSGSTGNQGSTSGSSQTGSTTPTQGSTTTSTPDQDKLEDVNTGIATSPLLVLLIVCFGALL